MEFEALSVIIIYDLDLYYPSFFRFLLLFFLALFSHHFYISK